MDDQLDFYRGLSDFGFVTAIGGQAMQLVGNFYAARSARNQAKAQADSLKFRETMAYRNARAAERDAQQELRAGRHEAAVRQLQTAQEKGAETASAAARGLAGTGSSAEVLASLELASQMDVLSIRTNAVRRANAARRQGVNYRNQGLLAGVSARNLRRTAGSISPAATAAGDLLRVGGTAARFYGQRQLNRLRRTS
jgi:hypothetical protein